MDSSRSDMENDPTAIFPRIDIRDPYKRLGISREASEEEIQAARNFLMQKYAVHKPNVKAIESAYDKIIMQTFYERKNPKFNIKKKVRDVSQARVVQADEQMPYPIYELHHKNFYCIYSAWGSHSSFQQKKALLFRAGGFILSWLLGTFLMVSVIPPILKGPRSLEVTTSFTTYVVLWVSCTYLQ